MNKYLVARCQLWVPDIKWGDKYHLSVSWIVCDDLGGTLGPHHYL